MCECVRGTEGDCHSSKTVMEIIICTTACLQQHREIVEPGLIFLQLAQHCCDVVVTANWYVVPEVEKGSQNGVIPAQLW